MFLLRQCGLQVGWNSLFSTDYSYVKENIFLSVGYPPADTHLRQKSGATRIGLALICKIQLATAHKLKQHDRRKCTVAIHRRGLWLLEPRMREYTLILHCKSTANTPPTHALHILQKTPSKDHYYWRQRNTTHKT